MPITYPWTDLSPGVYGYRRQGWGDPALMAVLVSPDGLRSAYSLSAGPTQIKDIPVDGVFEPVPDCHLRVSFDSDVLGAGVFWTGPLSAIGEISNLVARGAAMQAAVRQQSYPDGMWLAEVV